MAMHANFRDQFISFVKPFSTGILVAFVLLSATCLPAAEKQPNQKQIQFFESKIRPLLIKHCYDCHGPDEQESGLRVDTFKHIVKGGKAGALLVPGKPEQSILITAVNYQSADLKMPPEEKLSKQEIADLTTWVKIGAPYPNADMSLLRASKGKGKFDIKKEREFWSFQPVKKPAVPAVKNRSWVKNPIDQFVLHELEQAKITPAKPADKRTLIRRTTFDITGLPPTPQEIDNFLNDQSPQAFEKVVDRLLASPHYGEHWARHWLDIARYADSNGLDENVAYGTAWKYRDYVVNALNKDKPYDLFLKEQLAGDLLEPAKDVAERNERLIATGFLSLGPKVLAEVDETKMEMDIIDEQINTIGVSLMGMTLGCARCHDHKFDPISAYDYYGIAGILKSTKIMEHYKKVARWHENSLGTDAELKVQAGYDQKIKAEEAKVAALVKSENERLKKEGGKEFKLPAKPEPTYSKEAQAELKKFRAKVASLKKERPEIPTALGAAERETIDLPIHIRGSHLTLGETVPRHVPVVLNQQPQKPFSKKQSGRLEFAEWLGSRDHPLVSRVIANRVWRWHFGKGIVATPDNFGRLGAKPSNQALLDWLAVNLMDEGWSLKKLHRMILLSNTWQMSSEMNEKAAAIDPDNKLMWRADLRRLDAESIRDSILVVSDGLDATLGGSLLNVNNREFVFNHESKDGVTYDFNRRSIYLPVIRNHLFGMFMLFDYADASVLNGDRSSTTVAPQALFMLNSHLVEGASQRLADTILSQTALSPEQKIEQLMLKAYGRFPSEREVKKSLQFLQELEQELQSEESDSQKRINRSWQVFCQSIFGSSEFIYLR
ncbi:PSD1 and planctomycete cytochrome C domain-containing protein [uncultured Gimesia sp.]|uniref:PSD1 and planctomycete cytochrome C domain-containing protein n=1 Tax=uncultured Gimesia sp. TaxID=1678688 RepID=UPI00260CAF78|nr:PSD1 and planctomycete cytochrome C domain-containing protein [uncultured Gimesia sp.]